MNLFKLLSSYRWFKAFGRGAGAVGKRLIRVELFKAIMRILR